MFDKRPSNIKNHSEQPKLKTKKKLENKSGDSRETDLILSTNIYLYSEHNMGLLRKQKQGNKKKAKGRQKDNYLLNPTVD